jgi:endonuclease III
MMKAKTKTGTLLTELTPDPLTVEKTRAAYPILLQTYGELPLVPRRSPMRELISTMLSHRTNHANEEMAYEQMWKRFGSWEAIRDAPVDELTEAISTSTFPEAKAPNIKRALAQIIENRGEASIDFLQELPWEEGLAWLISLPGVGVKTATLVLLFCFAKPVLPVDTHVHRISIRLGLISSKTTAEAAHSILLSLFPPDPYILFNFHKAMLKHGQRLCTYNNPKCDKCPLLPLCDYGQQRIGNFSKQKGTLSS